MSIQDITPKDSVVATVVCNSANGAWLKINELEDAEPIVRLFEGRLSSGDVLLVSVQKISEDKAYIKTTLDSVISYSKLQVA